MYVRVQFSVGVVSGHLKRGKYATKLGKTAKITLAAVLEFLCAEILEASVRTSKAKKRSRIIPRDVIRAVRSDDDLTMLFGKVGLTPDGLLKKPARTASKARHTQLAEGNEEQLSELLGSVAIAADGVMPKEALEKEV